MGNTTTAFQTYVEQTLPLAEFKFCKAHDWRFLYKQNLSLTVASGTQTYSLTTGTIGYYMAADDVQSIWDQTNGRVLKKVTLKDLRRLDPKLDNGSANDQIDMWAPVGDNEILVHPKIFSNTTLKIDGKITPAALTTLSNYPTIPYRYQESFIEYVIAMALDRESDDRAQVKKQEATSMIVADIRHDLAQLGDTEHPRIRHIFESDVDGVGGADLERFYINWLFR